MSALPRTIKVELTSDEFVITARMLCQIDKSDKLYPAAESAFTKLFRAAQAANKKNEEGEHVRIPGVDGQVISAAAQMDTDEKRNPEWLWYEHDTGKREFGRWSKTENAAPYVRADLVLTALAECAKPLSEIAA